jgi:serine/threonine-protein kinase
LVAGIVLAWENLKKKRADMRGALRLAGFVLVVMVATWVLGASHTSSFWEAYSFTLELAWACLASVFLWMLYVALEPIVRRRIPTLLISWNRMLAGNFRDPMIGRDLLAGAAFGVFSQVLGNLDIFFNKWRGLPPPVPESLAFKIFTGGRIVFAQLFSAVPTAIFNGLALMLIVVILQIILRNRWVAAGAFMLIFVGQTALQGGSAFNVYFIEVIDVALLTFLVLRFGLLALTVYVFMQQIMSVPITTDTSAWYAWMGWFGVAVIAAIVFYGARIGLAGRPLFGGALVADD